MDASDYALATILSTVSLTDNEVHPIAFHSRTFMPPELNYDVHDKELLTMFEAFKIKFWETFDTPRYYDIVRFLHFIKVLTDHNRTLT